MADNKENAEPVFHYSPELEKKRNFHYVRQVSQKVELFYTFATVIMIAVATKTKVSLCNITW